MADETTATGEEGGGKKRRGASPRSEAPITPEPQNDPLFKFLVRLYEEGYPQKLFLHVVFGPGGKRIGPTVDEWTSRQEKPSHESLVELTNEILRTAQEDCDVLNSKNGTAYAIFALDTLKSDRYYARKPFRLFPTGTSQALAEMRGDIVDDEEGGGSMVAVVREMKAMIVEERKDKRWMMEAFANIVSGAMERDAARIEQLEEMNDGVFDSKAKYMAAMEQLLNQHEDRKARSDRNVIYNDMMREGFTLLKTTLIPAVATYVSKGKVGIVEGLQAFRDSLSEIAEAALMGEWLDGECKKSGILDADQVRYIIAVIERKIDPRTFPQFIDSIRPEQMAAVQGLVEQNVITFAQIQSLLALGKAAREATAGEAPQS